MLKTLAAALIATSLVAGPALAATGGTTAPAHKMHTKHHVRHHMHHHVKHVVKHKKHHMVRHHAVKHHTVKHKKHHAHHMAKVSKPTKADR